ncbi:MAG: RHS repeat-associated core domain-containing protein [Thermoanaerobaculia bacterium]
MRRVVTAVLFLLALVARAQDGLVEATALVPLGIEPPPGVLAATAKAPPCAYPEQQGCRDNVSLAAFRIDTWFPYGASALFPGGVIHLAIDSELAPGVPAPDTPPDLPPAHLRALPLRSQIDIAGVPELRHQEGANRHLSDWIVLIADPRASVHYDWPSEIAEKSTRDCVHCDRPLHLQGKEEGVREIRPTGPWLRIRLDLTPEQLAEAPPYLQDLAKRLDTRVRVIPADLTRPSTDVWASANPPTDGFRMTQTAMIHTREITFSATDLGVRARGTGVALTRVYSSAIAHVGPFGRNFDSPWFARVRELPNGSLELYDGTGRRDVFVPIGGALHAPAGVFLDLAKTAGGFVLTGRGEARMLFDARGRLTAMFDANATKSDGSDGNYVRFLYDDAGRLVTVIDPAGRPIHLQWDSGLVASITDFAGRRVDYEYDSRARLVEVRGSDPQSPSSEMPRTRYEWADPSGDFEERIYRAGQILRERDGEDRIAWEVVYDGDEPWAAAAILSGGGTTTIVASGNLREVVDPLGIKTTYEHDAAGRATKIADSQAAAQTYAFDTEGRLVSSTEPLGETAAYTYVDEGPRRHRANIATVTQHARPGTPEFEAGVTRTTAWKYDPFGRVSSITNTDGSTQTIARDARGNPAVIVDASGIATTNVFDERGLLQSTSDPRSGTTTFQYDAHGYLENATSAAGTTQIETDDRGNVVKVTDGGGRTATFAFNALDQLELEQRGDGETRLRYDATGAVVERRGLVGFDDSGEPLWQTTTSVIDELGRLRESTEDGVTTTWSYDAAGNTTLVQSPGSPPTVYDYDGLGRIASLAIGPRVTTYAYDANGRSAAVTDALGRTTTFLHDGFGASVGTIDATGVKTVDVHDAAGRPVESRIVKVQPDGTERLLRRTLREFDDGGRLVREIRKLWIDDPAAATDVVTRTVYDDEARTITQIDPLGRETRSETDEMGRLARVVDAAGNALEIEYDASGNRRFETFTEAGEGSLPPANIRYDYDDQNRLAAVVDVSDPRSPIATRYAYDRRGNVVSVEDPQGRLTRFEYDIRNRRTKIIDAIGAETRLEWDDAGRLVAVVDANGNRTEWVWDANGRLSEERRADGAKWVYAYDAQGNRVSMTDPNGTATTYERDALDRLTGVTIARAAGVLGPVSITYTLDDLGRVIATETSEGVKTTARYDSLDRNVAASVSLASPLRALERTFDKAGQPVGLRYPSGLTIARTFDPLGRIAEIRDAGTALLARYRDAGLRQIERETGNGVVDRWIWDANRRLTSIESGAPCGIAAGCDPLRRIDYVRGKAGAKLEVIRPDLALRKRYRLDALDRVTEEWRETWPDGYLARAVRYELDPLLNPLAIETETPQELARVETAVNARNQLVSFGPERLEWDENGNLRSRQGVTLQYDAADRLAKAALADGTTIEIRRDAFGRKVRETLAFQGSARVTEYVHDGPRVIEEYVGGTLAARYVHGRGIDEIVRAERDTNLDGTLDETLWPLQDELGTVDYLTNSTGGVTATFDYAPYGAPLTDPGDWPHLFQGREWNPHLRAYDFRARTLWPDLGRFGQEDPAGMGDSANRYQALLGNWADNSDPSGEVVVLMHGILSRGEWAGEVAEGLGTTWRRRGADPGQDVINLVNQKSAIFGPHETDFKMHNALNAAVAVLDSETQEAGKRTQDLLRALRAMVDSSSTRWGEPIHVIAHSHGTAMLLAAARQNGMPRLKAALLVGSDLNTFMGLLDLFRASDIVYNFFSTGDWTTGRIRAAGHYGFRDLKASANLLNPFADFPERFRLQPDTWNFKQIEVRGVAHTSLENQIPFHASTAWMTGRMALRYYGDLTMVSTARRELEPGLWITTYEEFRGALGLDATIPLTEAFKQPYPNN